jgi:hypothetical protein
VKRSLKKLARPLWLITGPIRRPIVRKFDRHMMGLLHLIPRPPAVPAELELALNSLVREPARPPAMPAELELVLNSLVRELARPPAMPAELELVLNSLVRELARLQVQVEDLRQQIDDQQSITRDLARPEGRLSVVSEVG